jgi:flagellar hook-basal body complex protein FliE
MSVNGIEALGGFAPLLPPTVSMPGVPGVADTATGAVTGPAGVTGGVTGVSPAGGSDFGSLLTEGLSRLEGLHDRADQLAVRAATGDLSSLHDYTITATEAGVATQLTTAVRNKALEAFQEIMRMSI